MRPLLPLIFLSFVPTLSLSAQTPAAGTVQANGAATIRVTPDQAELSVSVVTQATTAQEAGQQNAAQATAMINALKSVLGSAGTVQTPTPAETHWSAPYLEPGFTPNAWVDISAHLDTKLRALACYESQIRPAPDARSLDAVRALAVWRGAQQGMAAAEAFVTIRLLA